MRRLLRGQPVDRRLFLPTTFYTAARIDGGAAAELIGDPTRLSLAVIALSGLIESDWAAVRLEAPIWAAAILGVQWPAPDGAPTLIGDRGSVPTPETAVGALGPLIETIARLKAEYRGQKPVAAVVPGPSSLAQCIGDGGEPEVVAMLRAAVDAACKAGAEVVVIDESAGSFEAARLKAVTAPIVNTARYYNASTVLAHSVPIRERIADAILLPVGAAADVSPSMLVGVALAPRDLEDEAAVRTKEAIASHAPFVSVSDDFLAGREINDSLSALGAVLDMT